jgi:hypothetical protein
MGNLAITICSTKNYAYALKAQARRVVGTFSEVPLGKIDKGCIILVGDDSIELAEAENFYRDILPENFEVKRIISEVEDGLPNYQPPAQLAIAKMRSLAFSEARRMRNFDLCWSLDSDVLPPYNSLNCMMQMLEFDNGYYGVACCPYPSQGGGDFLGGRGTENNPILPDCYEDERILSKDLGKRLEEFKKDFAEAPNKQEPTLEKRRKEILEEISRSPTKGDVFFLNSHTGVNPFIKRLKESISNKPEFISLIEEEEKSWKALGYRRRGWLSSAYPGIGLGAVVPIDWFGFGCNLLNRKALSLAQFEGYEGGGTEDLYVIRKKWLRNGLRMVGITHCPCDHVIRDPNKPGEFILLQSYHETQNQECIGHLRREFRPWYQQVDGETVREVIGEKIEEKKRTQIWL